MVALVARPLAHDPVAPGRVGVREAVRRTGNAHQLEVSAGVEAKGSDDVRRAAGRAVVLEPYGLSGDAVGVRHRNGEAIAEAAHAVQRAEVVIERAVLLHQHDDVLDVLDRSGPTVRSDRQRFANGGGKHAEGETSSGRSRGPAQEVTTIGCHGISLRARYRSTREATVTILRRFADARIT
jgi:hypothetical protein